MSASNFSDTIAAISTPAGEGAIALIRVSGPDALAVADKTFRAKRKPSELPARVQSLGEIVADERIVDHVMLAVHRAPASYTGEDVVEICCHGGMLVTSQVLRACLGAGARAARPGEFTERAFLNGKMDLTQAEAVMDLIRAQTDLALRSATEQLEGRLGEKVNAIREELIGLLAHLEAYIDFPDEDIDPETGQAFLARLDGIRAQIDALLATADQGRILREGVRTVIYGATNAGKSSLLNRLLGFDRAIVSEIPGTTRDTIEEVINLRGVPLRLVDTAGLRASQDTIEQEGIARTERSLETADLALHVVDGSEPVPIAFHEPREGRAEILVINKCDLPEHGDWQKYEGVRISCREERGLDALAAAVIAQISGPHGLRSVTVAINTRHRDCLRRAMSFCDDARTAMTNGLAPEYVAVDLHAALGAVGDVVGPADSDEILGKIFSTFCIGK